MFEYLFMALLEAQKRQVEKQLIEHRHSRYAVDIRLSDSVVLSSFVVHEGVMRPERMTSLRLARFLFENHRLYDGRDAMDMGCGSGLQGIVMAINGARYVHFSDISSEAVANTVENVGLFCPNGKADIHSGDLFEKLLNAKVDIIVFNHPFFPGSPEGLEPAAASMLDPGTLIHRFLGSARRHLTDAGRIIMPFFHLAGEVNNPGAQAPGHGYEVVELERTRQDGSLQNGDVSIYELRPRRGM
jgi:methylase of polypeptide subunit release factors